MSVTKVDERSRVTLKLNRWSIYDASISSQTAPQFAAERDERAQSSRDYPKAETGCGGVARPAWFVSADPIWFRDTRNLREEERIGRNGAWSELVFRLSKENPASSSRVTALDAIDRSILVDTRVSRERNQPGDLFFRLSSATSELH